ncbi:dnaJ homolog subfamily C member 14 [Abrus precatorius]|uniref:DnaJ homolog subfamily C member 14 n=1 Tax=Abrus precatorius TaxID=3816 RepID=A0A8B8LJP3_ABRPR|nr:dnaJ homolog subfamily C member 14 [Abrus precatorius]
MARKGNQQKNGVDRHGLNHKKGGGGGVLPGMKGKGGPVKVFPGEEPANGDRPAGGLSHTECDASSACDDYNNEQRSEKIAGKEKQGMAAKHDLENSLSSGINSGDGSLNSEIPVYGENGTLPRSNQDQQSIKSRLSCILDGLHVRGVVERVEFADNMIIRRLRLSVFSIITAVTEWITRQAPLFVSLKTITIRAYDNIRTKVAHAYPVVLKWLMHFGSIMLLLSVFWLDCTLRGIDSFVRMGTTSFFTVIWCSIFSVISMIGMLKFLVVLGLAALIGFFLGLMLAILVVAILGVVTLWFYGSFWTTAFFIILGGLAFMLSHERMALFITTGYSVYCAWLYVGWLGLLLAFNLAFISSDILIYFLKKNIDQQSRSNPFEQTAGMHGQPGFNDEPMQGSSSENGPGPSADRNAGVPSTSGVDSDVTSEDEVVRLLNCSDHYSALGLTRYQNIDVSILKREYRKKAMLVHPDKNMGNEKAAEAFKKLQNAYEILMDSLKRKAYDDELRREELLSVFRRFHDASRKNGRHGFFSSGFARSDADGEDPFGDSRRIACKKCGGFHVWIHTKKQKSRARWCQDCQDFHQAKDGDGWVEQSSQPFLFGLLQKVVAPLAYVCADSRIYNATEWYICQGMRCPANTHKPSFHVNTSLMSKHSSGKGATSAQRGGRMPTPNIEETMTEEEFFEWFQNAVQAGVFDNYSGTAAESPSSKSGNGMKSPGNGSGSSTKRKKKGKKQW